jgi:hypothetical protein
MKKDLVKKKLKQLTCGHENAIYRRIWGEKEAEELCLDCDLVVSKMPGCPGCGGEDYDFMVSTRPNLEIANLSKKYEYGAVIIKCKSCLIGPLIGKNDVKNIKKQLGFINKK